MSDVLNGLTVMLFVGGAIYFWQRSRSIGFELTTIIICYLLFPLASVIGLYWLFRDMYYFYKK